MIVAFTIVSHLGNIFLSGSTNTLTGNSNYSISLWKNDKETNTMNLLITLDNIDYIENVVIPGLEVYCYSSLREEGVELSEELEKLLNNIIDPFEFMEVLHKGMELGIVPKNERSSIDIFYDFTPLSQIQIDKDDEDDDVDNFLTNYNLSFDSFPDQKITNPIEILSKYFDKNKEQKNDFTDPS